MMSEMTSALIGLAGTLIAVAVAYLGGLASGRRAYNADRIGRQYDYLTDVVHAADAQVIRYGLLEKELREEIERLKSVYLEGGGLEESDLFQPSGLDKLAVATDAWRLVLAKRVIWARPELNKAMEEFDVQRAAVVHSYQTPSIPEFHQDVEILTKHCLQSVYLAVRLAVLELNAVLVHDMMVGPKRWRATREIKKALSVQRKKIEEHAGAHPVRDESASAPAPEGSAGGSRQASRLPLDRA